MAHNEILLGDGVFSIVTSSGASAIDFLTRGGGRFRVEDEFRVMEADGDYGPVFGRIRKIRSVATMEVNALELLQSNLDNYFAGMMSVTGAASSLMTGMLTFTSSAYLFQVYFSGHLWSSQDVVITINNPLNMEPIELSLVDKEEVVPRLVFTGTYASSARTTPPWTMTMSTP